MENIKILLVSPLPPPSGGIASWTQSLLRKASENSDVNILHVDTAVRWRESYEFSTFKRVVGGSLHAFYIILKILFVYHKERFKVLHVCTSASFSCFRDILIFVLARILGVRSVIHYRFGRLPSIIANMGIEWKLIRIVMNLADKIVVLDEKSKESVMHLIPGAAVQVIPNPIDVTVVDDFYSQIKKSTEDAYNVVYVGHVIPTKGIVELVDVCSRIEEYPLELHLVGAVSNEFRRKLYKISRKNREGQWLHFHGEVSHQQALMHISNADSFILPSYTEGFPNVVLEAMALGKPIIATRVGAVHEMLGDDPEITCGLIIDPQNMEQLHEAIMYIIKHKEEALFLGNLARQKVIDCYSMDKILKEYQDLWKNTFINDPLK